MMGVLGWILFGFVVGLIARAIMPGRDPLGLVGTTLLGIVGALAAGWIGQAFGWYTATDGAGFVAATIGAIVVLAIYYAVTGRKRLGISGYTHDEVRPLSRDDVKRDDRAA
jgi:uncharacterized membrane protein YeaQ/YmgE (transglycosylase-associated protein family)